MGLSLIQAGKVFLKNRALKTFHFQVFSILFISFLFCPFAKSDLTISDIDRLLLCYKRNMEARAGKEKYLFAMGQIPQDRFYKLFIDQERLKTPTSEESKYPPHLIFDVEEPGYHNAMVEAFEFVAENIGVENDLDFIIQLHDRAVSGVSAYYGAMRTGISSGWKYVIDKSKIEPLAFEELFLSHVLLIPHLAIEQLRSDDFGSCESDKYIFQKLNMNFLSHYESKDGFVVSHSTGHAGFTEEILKPILQHYNDSIQRVKSLHGKLLAISEVLRILEVFHIFPDGNQRTYAFLLLNKLLIENDIPPVILDDPTQFDGFMSLENMVEKIKKGIVNYFKETETNQRHLLNHECNRMDTAQPEEEFYLNSPGLEYLPYFKIPGRKSAVDKLRKDFRKEVSKSISEKKLDYAQNPSPLTLLSTAILYGDRESIQTLLAHGADPLKFDDVGSPLVLTVEMRDQTLFNLLITYLQRGKPDQFDLVMTLRLIEKKTDMKEFILPLVNLFNEQTLKKYPEFRQLKERLK